MSAAHDPVRQIHGQIQRELRSEALRDQSAAALEKPRVVELENVHLAFSRPILKGVSIRAHEGETLLVVGESGTGKSTILKLILRLLLPDDGKVCVLGHEVTKLTFQEALDLRRRIGMVFQSAALFDSLTVFENVAYPIRENMDVSDDELERMVREKLQFVDLDAETVMPQLPSQLSGGMRKRVGIARAIATSPELILYDEPTSGLDPLTTGTINQLIRKLQKELNVTSIVVTHDLRSGFKIASRVNLLRDGEVVFEGSPEDMVTADDPYIQSFLS